MFKKKNKNSSKENENTKDSKYLSGLMLAKMALGGAARLRSNADEVNKLNVFPVPDGDTGDNMRMTIESGIAALESIDSDDLSEVMKVLSHGMLLGARGNSGVILSQLFAGIAKGFEFSDKADPASLGNALKIGVKQAYSSVMTPTEGTILTVAREAVDYAVERITPESTIRTFFADLVKEMRASLEHTPEILSVLKEAGVVDSGGAGLFYIMDGFNRVLNGEEMPDDDVVSNTATKSANVDRMLSFGPDSDMIFGYCTELLLQLQNSKTDVENFDIEELKEYMSELGDSIVAFKTDSIVKLHVHTMLPDKVLKYCRRHGEFISVKIENMSLQHTAMEEKDKEEKAEKAADNSPKKQYGVVAVSQGPGIDILFSELGADQIVPGGQTQNPSTNDFISAFEKVNAEHIFVFPNNGNILMAAQQAAAIYTDAAVHVIPSKNIGTGYVAISSIDFENPDCEAVIAEMQAAMKRVTAGYISPSIRDADISGIHINKGDTIGIIEKEIVVSDIDKATAAHALASKLLSMPEKFMLTAFFGSDSSQEECDALEARLRGEFPSAEIYFINGGQDIYPYIFVAE